MSIGAQVTQGLTGSVMPAMVPGASQKVTIGASSLQSTAFGVECTLIRVFASVDCYILIGTNPTATTNTIFCPGGVIQFFGITFETANLDKIAVIQSSVGGTLYITEGV